MRYYIIFAPVVLAVSAFAQDTTVDFTTQTNSLGVVTGQPLPETSVVTSQPLPVTTQPSAATTQPSAATSPAGTPSVLPSTVIVPVGTAVGSGVLPISTGSSSGIANLTISSRRPTSRSSSTGTPTSSEESSSTGSSTGESSSSTSDSGNGAGMVQPLAGLGLAGILFAAFL